MRICLQLPVGCWSQCGGAEKAIGTTLICFENQRRCREPGSGKGRSRWMPLLGYEAAGVGSYVNRVAQAVVGCVSGPTLPQTARGLLIKFRTWCVCVHSYSLHVCACTTLLLLQCVYHSLCSSRVCRPQHFPYHQERHCCALLRGLCCVSCLLRRLRLSAETLSVWWVCSLFLIWVRVGVGNLI